MILQDPQTSLNPVFTVGNQLLESIRIQHPKDDKPSLLRRAVYALKQVRVAAPERRISDYPHQIGDLFRCAPAIEALSIPDAEKQLIYEINAREVFRI